MFSIVVATFNRASMLRTTLESLLAQETRSEYEVVVVDNNSSDNTRSLVRELEEDTSGKLRYVFEGKQGSSPARNTGIRAARGEIIAFADDDAIAEPSWLQALEATYQAHHDAWCVGGMITLRLPETRPAWFDPASPTLGAYLARMDRGEGTMKIQYPEVLWGPNISVRRDVLLHVGLFHTGLGHVGQQRLGSEDDELCHRIQRAGGTVYYCGEAKVIHVVPRSHLTKGYFRKRAYWEGRSSAIVYPQDPRRPLWKKVASAGLGTARDGLRVCAHYVAGDVRRAYERELKVWLRLGNLHQTLINHAPR